MGMPLAGSSWQVRSRALTGQQVVCRHEATRHGRLGTPDSSSFFEMEGEMRIGPTGSLLYCNKNLPLIAQATTPMHRILIDRSSQLGAPTECRAPSGVVGSHCLPPHTEQTTDVTWHLFSSCNTAGPHLCSLD